MGGATASLGLLLAALPSQLGFLVERTQLAGGGAEVRFIDSRYGRVTRVEYSGLGTIKSREIATRGGRLLRRVELWSNEQREETFVGSRTLVVSRSAPGGYRVTTTRWPKGGGEPTFTEQLMGYEVTGEGCGIPRAVSNLDALMADSAEVVRVRHDGSAKDEDDIEIAPNVRAKGCTKYPKNGVAGIVRDFSDAMNQGTRCLADLGSRFPGPKAAELRTKAAEMLGFFQPEFKCTFKLVCAKEGDDTLNEGIFSRMAGTSKGIMNDSKVAHAIGPDGGHPEWPIIALNMSAKPGYWKGNAQYPKAVLFHEMLHTLGIKHAEGDGLDMVYLAQSCCFPTFLTKKAGPRNVACDLLSNYDPKNEDQKMKYRLIKELIVHRKAAYEGVAPDNERIESLENTLSLMDPKNPAPARTGSTARQGTTVRD